MIPPQIHRAMVLAAGLGKRMRPITDTLPKPLVPVLGRAMLGRALDQLAAAGVTDSVINAHYLADQIAAYVAAYAVGHPTPRITLRREEALLETGGGVVNALDLLGDTPFFAVNADTLWFDAPGRSALQRLAAAFNPARMDALLLIHPTADAVGYEGDGDLALAHDGRLRFRHPGEVVPYAFAGVSVTHAAALTGRRAEPFSMSEVWRAAAAEGRLFGLVHDGLWLHVGTPEHLVAAENFLRARGYPDA